MIDSHVLHISHEKTILALRHEVYECLIHQVYHVPLFLLHVQVAFHRLDLARGAGYRRIEQAVDQLSIGKLTGDGGGGAGGV
jgi:hypothetical protein